MKTFFLLLVAIIVGSLLAYRHFGPKQGGAGPNLPEPEEIPEFGELPDPENAPEPGEAAEVRTPPETREIRGAAPRPEGRGPDERPREPFSFASCSPRPVHGAVLEPDGDNAFRLRMPSAEWSCGLRLDPPAGRRSLDLSGARWLAVDVENLSPDRQMRLTMHVSSGGANSEAADHAVANFTRNLAANTGIGLNPGEKATMRLLLPHPSYATPDGAPGPRLVDTARVNAIEFQCQWPFEDEFKWVADCRLSGLRLEGEPLSPPPQGAAFFPFVDRYGQYRHAEWPEKVHSDADLRADLERERAEIAASPHPASWDRYGGWSGGPRLAATGHFRTERVDGRWWLVTPEGHLFFSTGIDVVRDNVDAPDGSRHPDWYETPVPPGRSMSFPAWNLAKKFGRDDYLPSYYEFVQRRLRSWGINTIGNWSGRELLAASKMPYAVSVLERAKGVKRHAKFQIYDFEAPDFEERMRTAIRERFATDETLRRAASDPLCIGFFVDNELQFQKWIPEVGAERAAPLLDLYFRLCREEIARAAPGKLYLGSRFVGFRQPGVLWRTAARHCDVITVNAYCNSIANISEKLFEPGREKPILLGEFHFGCMDRGMFRASLCPVGDQAERGRSYARLVQGALRHPLLVGCHWFQYRDQPLVGRGDGEAYQCGFVDATDRPYRELCAAAREIGETMYPLRASGRLPGETAP